MSQQQKINEVCENASRIVASWPEWKQRAVRSVFSQDSNLGKIIHAKSSIISMDCVPVFEKIPKRSKQIWHSIDEY